MATKKKKAVVVTTEHRGVFFGYVENDKKAPEQIELSDVRNCVYWDSSIKGVLGLAANGPGRSCKVGPNVPKATIWKLTGIWECSADAVKQWEAQPWN